jgi:hypothetical protein
MSRIIQAGYSGTLRNSFSVTVENSSLDEDLHKMIVWIMLNPDRAQHLVPEYLYISGQDAKGTR